MTFFRTTRTFCILMPFLVIAILYMQHSLLGDSIKKRIKSKSTSEVSFLDSNHTIVSEAVSNHELQISRDKFTAHSEKRTERATNISPSKYSASTETPNLQIKNVTIGSDKFVYHKQNFSNSFVNMTKRKRKIPNDTICPHAPPTLVGKIAIRLTRLNFTMKDLKRGMPGIRRGGRWSPKSCIARDRVAIVIPFRDRHQHLLVLLYYLIPMLQRQMLDFRIFVPEQFGNGTFNKGRLMNAAALEAMAVYDFRCIIFHDVDLIPEDDRNMYSCQTQPFHHSIAIDQWKYIYMYDKLVGGVLNLRRDHLLKVNGYSNNYWGWGAEDDDMGYRITASKLHIIRPPGILGRYKSIPHKKRSATEKQSKNNAKLLRKVSKTYTKDGLNNVPYKVLETRVLPLYTHYMIDVGTSQL